MSHLKLIKGGGEKNQLHTIYLNGNIFDAVETYEEVDEIAKELADSLEGHEIMIVDSNDYGVFITIATKLI